MGVARYSRNYTGCVVDITRGTKELLQIQKKIKTTQKTVQLLRKHYNYAENLTTPKKPYRVRKNRTNKQKKFNFTENITVTEKIVQLHKQQSKYTNH